MYPYKVNHTKLDTQNRVLDKSVKSSTNLVPGSLILWPWYLYVAQSITIGPFFNTKSLQNLVTSCTANTSIPST